ncbi:YrhC family protein [Geobacillus stearothermophilus]|uniref:YrhC family protein n=1 Tax=Geobacillus stearothermophilus TaxID=1422 RepID=UPI00240271FC|nr:YrhC family protein [Geobacillus stearothermophilus]MDF9296050.1 YrhC family protein [Geobacillus stearothermophilus]
MNEQQRDELRAKAGDFKMYSLVLFSLGAFFYFGTMIPGALEAAKKPFALLAVAGCLAAALYCSRRAARYVCQLEEENPFEP